MLKIFIGYDPNEAVAYHVCAHSILRRASIPVSITPICLKSVGHLIKRTRDENQSTEFAFSRFLVPYLSEYRGYSIFMDCDMLVRCDIAELVPHLTSIYDVQVVKHDYIPKTTTKFLGQKQSVYPRKNWSSVMLFNNNACQALTPSNVSEMSGAWLHQFQWAEDRRIGELPVEWNHLVGEYDNNPNAKIVHFTLGTPCFNEYANQEYAEEWFAEREAMLYAKN